MMIRITLKTKKVMVNFFFSGKFYVPGEINLKILVLEL
jgi:hypothetical protein